MRYRYTFVLLFIAFLLNIRPVSAQTIRTYAGDGFGAGTGTGDYTGDGGPATVARMNSCTAVAFDGAGNIYIADRDNNVVRKVGYNGIISTFAGTGTAGFNGDTGIATSIKLNMPYGVASDVPGNVYITDYGNHRVRKVDVVTGRISTIAGTGVAGYTGDGGPATDARMNNPQAIAIDQDENLYVTEAQNHVVRKITAAGSISTIAGNGTFGFSGNGGPAVLAQLNGPAGVAVDVYGNIYIADQFNNVVRMVDTDGNISNFAGNNTLGYSGDEGPAVSAQLHLPSGVSVYGHGDVYIADQANNTVRRVDGAGIIHRFAGTTTNGYSGDGGLALYATLASPKGLAVDGVGRVYIADYDNNVIRLVAAPLGAHTAGSNSMWSVYPDPSAGVFNITLPAIADASVTVMDITGRVVAVKKVNNTRVISIDLGSAPPGNYFIKAISGDKVYNRQVVLSR